MIDTSNLLAALAEARTERDEARQEMYIRGDKVTCLASDLYMEREAHKITLAERDEARAALANSVPRETWVDEIRAFERMTRERDEARALLKKKETIGLVWIERDGEPPQIIQCSKCDQALRERDEALGYGERAAAIAEQALRERDEARAVVRRVADYLLLNPAGHADVLDGLGMRLQSWGLLDGPPNNDDDPGELKEWHDYDPDC